MNEMLIPAVITALGWAVLLILIGELAGTRLPLLRKIFLPGSVLGGLLALILGPQLAGLAPGLPDTETSYEMVGEFPSLFINGVFACLMLGRPLKGLRSLWKRSYRQVIMGHVFAWGQYVVGLGLVLAVLGPAFGLSSLAGPVIAIGFQGGHGTAAGLGATFNDLDFADGVTVAYALATFGIVAGAVGGPILATVLRRRSPVEEHPAEPKSEEPGGGSGPEKSEEKPKEFSPLTGRFTLHLALIAIIIGAAWFLLSGLVRLETLLRGVESSEAFVRYIPLFSVVLLMGMGMQFFLQAMGWTRYFDRGIFDLISAFSLDLVIFGALATLKLTVVGEHWPSILLLCLSGLAWNLLVLFLLGPRMYPKPWYPYGLGDFGGGTATTASGLLLISITDPSGATDALRAYSGKQPFYEPFMGGGLVTAFALPLVAAWGAGVALAVTAGILAVWIFIALRVAPSSS